MWRAGQTLPQCLVESEAREVEETQVLLCYHAVEVVTAETNVSTAASEDKAGNVLTHWAHSSLSLYQGATSARERFDAGREV